MAVVIPLQWSLIFHLISLSVCVCIKGQTTALLPVFQQALLSHYQSDICAVLWSHLDASHTHVRETSLGLDLTHIKQPLCPHTHTQRETHTLTHRHQIQTAQTELFPEANIWHLTNSEATEWCFALRLFKHSTESSLKTSVYKAMDSYEEKTVLLLLIALKSHWMWFQMCVCICIYMCGTVPWI